MKLFFTHKEIALKKKITALVVIGIGLVIGIYLIVSHLSLIHIFHIIQPFPLNTIIVTFPFGKIRLKRPISNVTVSYTHL